MGFLDYLIIALVAMGMIAVVVSGLRKKKHGCSGCSCSCNMNCDSCHKSKE